MQFDEAVQYLLSLGHETLAIKLGLRNTELLLNALNNPERAFPSVQIAGTNGKGSTAAMLESICRAAGIKCGLYTSPHLVSITERIRISGVEITREDFAACATARPRGLGTTARDKQIEALPTFFEQLTAIALLAFRNAGIELAILETGLGGRLDSTTAANASIVAVTQIALDHEEYLGHTLESIAAEKAAIIRPGVNAVIARQQPEALEVLLKRCEETGVTPILENGHTQSKGTHPMAGFVSRLTPARIIMKDVLLGLAWTTPDRQCSSGHSASGVTARGLQFALRNRDGNRNRDPSRQAGIDRAQTGVFDRRRSQSRRLSVVERLSRRVRAPTADVGFWSDA